MAKNKVKVDVKVTDDGTLKETGKKAKKTAGQFDVLNQSSRQADRAGKGLARTSSNQTKNFSKMSQGISGGLVPAYAVLAANIFALSAAFRFLQDAMDTANMIKGQQAFGSITGVAYQTITRDVQKATEGMLQFKEAASAVAIGIAAGLTGAQLEQLGEAAKNVSLALGRDLTDSFERLIRGVTKAEPELLDELGIVLRLENATNKYALTIGKTREELNAFERTQAVMADVLDQATQKFGRITEIMDPDAFALGQLSKEMDDMLTTFKVLMARTLTPVFRFLSENIAALVLLLSVVLFPILKAIGPNFEGMYKKARIAGKRMESQIVDLTAKTLMYKGAVDKTGKSLGQYVFGKRQESAKGIVGMLQEGGAKGKGIVDGQIGLPTSFKYNQDASLSMRASQQMTQDDIDHYSQAAEKKSGIFKDWSSKALRQFHTHLAIQQVSLKISEEKNTKIIAKGWMNKWFKGLKRMGLAMEKWKFNMILKLQDLGDAMQKWMGRLQLVMFGFVAFSIAKNFITGIMEKMKPREHQKMIAETKEITESLGSLNEELRRMNQVRFEGLLVATDGLTQLGNALTSVDLVKKIEQYNREIGKGGLIGRKDRKANRKEFIELANQLRKLDPAFESLYKTIVKGHRLTEELVDEEDNPLVETWVDHYNAVRQSSQALTEYRDNVQAVNSAVDKTIRQFSKMPYQDITKALAVSTTSLKYAIGDTGLGTGLKGQIAQKTAVLTSDEHKGGVLERKKEFARLQANMRDLTRIASAQIDLQAMLAFLKPYGGTEDSFTDWISKQKTGLEDASKELRNYEQELVRQQDLEKSMLDIQGKAIVLQETELTNQLLLAQAGIGGSKAVKVAKELNTLQKQQNKENQARLDIQTAEAALALTKQRVTDMINNIEKEGIEYTQEEIDLMNVENENAKVALSNARIGLTVQEELTNNAIQQHSWNMENLDIEERKLQLTMDRLKAERNIASIQLSAAHPAFYGFGKAGRERGAKRMELVGRGNMAAQGMAASRRTLLNTAGTEMGGFSMKDLTDPSGITAARIGEITNPAAKTALTDYMNFLREYERISQELVNHQAEQQFFAQNMLMKENEVLEVQLERGTKVNPAEEIFLKAKLGYLQAGFSLEEFNLKFAKETLQLARQQAELNRDIAMDELKRDHEKLKAKSQIVYTLNPAEQLFQQNLLEWEAKHGVADAKRIADLKQMAIEETKLTIQMDLMLGVQNAMSDGFKGIFAAMVDGTQSFKDAMKSLFADFMQKMANMLAEAVALRMMMNFTGGWLGGASGSLMPKATSTTVSTSGGGGWGSFQGGGIASGPQSGYLATLHGNEAVVPLGHGKSIPVKFDKSGAYKETNITVNVAAGGQQQTTTTKAGEKERKLGQMIAFAVQAEILDQQRPGGILSPYGDGGM